MYFDVEPKSPKTSDVYSDAVKAMNNLVVAIKEALEADTKAYKDQDYTDEAAVAGAIRSINRRVKEVIFNQTRIDI